MAPRRFSNGDRNVSNRTGFVLRAVLLTGLALIPAAVLAQAPNATPEEVAPQASTIAPSGIFNLPGTAPLLPPPEPTPPAGEAAPAEPAPAAPEAAAQAPSGPPEPAPAAASPPAPAAPPAAVNLPPPLGPRAPGSPPAPATERVTVEADKPVISTGVAAIVNDYVISDYDLNQRVALFIATSGVRPTPETLTQIRAQVLRSVEDEILQLQEAAKHKISVSKTEVDRALQNIANDNKIPVEQIIMTVTSAGVTVDTFRQQIAAQLTWQKVVGARYGTDVLINEQQVDEAMERLKAGADKPQFLVSEIFIAVDRPEDETMVGASAKQIADQLKQGAPFATVASQFSQSPSAADGGDIGWVVQGQLSEDLDGALSALKPGETSEPVRAEGGYYVVLLRDRREPIGTVIEDNPAALVFDPEKEIPLDRLLVPLPPNSSDMIKERAIQLGTNIRNSVRSCNDLPTVSSQLQGSVYTRLGQMKPAALAQDLRDALEKTEPGRVVEPFFSPAGLEVIMRCDTPIVKPVVFQLPTREELEQQLFVQQMSVFAKSYLRDLRRNAVVETR
jgi:peptidyl-prolyl cis-trans isomerase SurA